MFSVSTFNKYYTFLFLILICKLCLLNTLKYWKQSCAVFSTNETHLGRWWQIAFIRRDSDSLRFLSAQAPCTAALHRFSDSFLYSENAFTHSYKQRYCMGAKCRENGEWKTVCKLFFTHGPIRSLQKSLKKTIIHEGICLIKNRKGRPR